MLKNSKKNIDSSNNLFIKKTLYFKYFEPTV